VQARHIFTAVAVFGGLLTTAGAASSATGEENGASPVTARIDVGADAWTLAEGPDGSVWSEGAKGLVRIDPTRNAISVRTHIRGTANAGAGSIWTVSGPSLRRLDPTSGEVQATIGLPHPGESVLVTRRVAWVTSPDTQSLMRVDLSRQKVTASVPTCDVKWHGLGATSRSIWVACYLEGQLLRVDTRTNRVVRRIRLAYGVHSLAVGAGSIWINNHETGRLTRVEAATGRILARLRTSTNPAIVFARGAVWAAGDTAVHEIDPATNRVAERLPVGPGEYYGLAYASGSLWLSTIAQRQIVRLNPEVH
jgi:streptogramin lyase